MKAVSRVPATLALRDGTVFRGYSIGKEGTTSGEVVFNTSMTGYQEILTDPSYAFQMVTFTCPHIGNVGVNNQDQESRKIQAAGLIVRAFSEAYSNYRAKTSLQEYLESEGIVGISGIDTRALVLHLRTHGAQIGVIASGEYSGKNSGENSAAELVEKTRSLPAMEGLDLVKQVSTAHCYEWRQGVWQPTTGYREYSEHELKNRPLVVAVDYGIKFNILRLLVDQGFRVLVVPGSSSAEEILSHKPDGIFLANGPGDPAAVHYAREAVRGILGKKPIFGICLGHQILGLAFGAKTFKLKFGHRGANHPVRNEATKAVEITCQNHGFAIDAQSVPKFVQITHRNLNDGTVEGLCSKEHKAFSIQYHPEASPGPHDARYLFYQFKELVING